MEDVFSDGNFGFGYNRLGHGRPRLHLVATQQMIYLCWGLIVVKRNVREQRINSTLGHTHKMREKEKMLVNDGGQATQLLITAVTKVL